jgi:hypothetical protein
MHVWTSLKCKDCEKLRQSCIHILMVNCMETEFGLGEFRLFPWYRKIMLLFSWLTSISVDCYPGNFFSTSNWDIAFALPLLFKLFTSILLLMLFVQHRPWHWSHSHSTFVLFILFRSWTGIWLLRWLWTVGKNYSCYCLFYKLLI